MLSALRSMASTLTRTPILRAISARSYSQALPVSGNPSAELRTSTLPNKLVVAAVDNDASLTRVSIVFRAGSRNEKADNLGATHIVRTAAGLSTKNASQFAIIRNIQQVGANLTATSDRETISYTLEGTRSAVEKALPYLAEVATHQEFRPWEVSELSNRLILDILTRPLQLRAIDLLHNAAYRSKGLGNSLFIPKSQVGKVSSETLQHYVASNFVAGRAAVVGTGVSESLLNQFAASLGIANGEGSTNPSPYKGGELRSNKGGPLAFVAVGGEGAPLKNTKEALAFAVLQKAVCAGPQIKYGVLDNGVYSKALGGSSDVSACAVNVSYSDSGLFGILLAAPAGSVGKAVQSAVNVLKSGSVTDADVQRGKNQLKTAILLNAESGADVVRELGTQAVLAGAPQSANALAAAVDSVSTSDVQSALRKAGGKLTLAAIGNINDVPYLDELK
ncbi:cytochrome b-c1 complex subunit 2, mitochondrial isoform X1 [Diabrotica virgifera virgifera]|uniref:Cytochrome b-c1 complex subunit 2, mitochondrial isoform X1 n=2 Tax=Diabrotica virgifera virgifera TaxID=50390 RepID=A0A6P7GTX7_DIAVI|nr:cytochrome b-c1 complex subunit 2, mitochondrial isoform X1 [Diabrotica virgifera virgifera]